jgi:hypothetical protein
MEHAAPAIFMALEHSAFAAAIRQSSWLYLAANVGHVASLTVFAGALAVMDMRLAGLFAATSPATVVRGARRVAIAAFLGLAMTGFLLFAAEASHVVVNRVFQIKMALIVFGLANVAVATIAVMPGLSETAPHTPLPRAARFTGAASLVIWLAVAVCGRSIAYF